MLRSKGFYLEIIFLFVLVYFFLFHPSHVVSGIQNGLHTCVSIVLPSLFPFFVLSNYWIYRGYSVQMGHYAAPVFRKLFHIPGAASSAFLLGLLGGYPLGITTAVELYQAGLLTKDETEHCFAFCSNSGPAFVIGVLGTNVFCNPMSGISLYLCQILASILTAFIFRKNAEDRADHSLQKKETLTVSKAITYSINQSGETAFRVCIFILFFSVLVQILFSVLPISNIGILSCLLSGFLELSIGAKSIISANCPIHLKFIISALFIAWGGMCVMIQSISFIQKTPLSAKKLWLGKTVQTILCGLLAAIFSMLFPIPQPSISSHVMSYHYIIPVMFLIIVFVCLTIVKKLCGKKRECRL